MPRPVRLLKRHSEERILSALKSYRIVALMGPRQCGKSTLVRKIADHLGMAYLSLDHKSIRDHAKDQPHDFVQSYHEGLVIDEIQRAPQLILAIKMEVDVNPQPGQYLITGSVDLLRNTRSPDSLAGRITYIRLLPFSQSEKEGSSPSPFIQRAFDKNFPSHGTLNVIEEDLTERVLRGGFPEAQNRDMIARFQWLNDYAYTQVLKDSLAVGEVMSQQQLWDLISSLSLLSGNVLNISALSTRLEVSRSTITRCIHILTQLYVIEPLPPWHVNRIKRQRKTPKIHFLDSGLLAAMRYQHYMILPTDSSYWGSLLEGFVFSELKKQSLLMYPSPLLSHYQHHHGGRTYEVDFILERGDRIVGIEVKAARDISRNHTHGLHHLKEMVGEKFVCGIVFYCGHSIQALASDIFALPLQMLWQSQERD